MHDEDAKRGRPSRKRYAENMIENIPSPDPRKPSAALDEARLRQQAIGVRLRQMFDEVVNEDVPDEFLDILRRADTKTPEHG
jgi:Anti-sigma factor NepR